jgi:hypothetical protein
MHACCNTEPDAALSAVVQEVHSVLERAYRKAARKRDESDPTVTGPLNFAIEYRNTKGKMVPVVQDADVRRFSSAIAIYVTTTVAPQLQPSSPTPSTSEDELADVETGSTLLVDLSLSGCCGIQSTYGGLTITSEPYYLDSQQSSSGSKSSVPRTKAHRTHLS